MAVAALHSRRRRAPLVLVALLLYGAVPATYGTDAADASVAADASAADAADAASAPAIDPVATTRAAAHSNAAPVPLVATGASAGSAHAATTNPASDAVWGCNNSASRCSHTVELPAGSFAPTVLCVYNDPMATRRLLVSGGLARLFDMQSVRIRRDRGPLAGAVDIHTASEDTFLSSSFSASAAETQAQAAFPTTSVLGQKVHRLGRAVRAAWEGGGGASERIEEFSPFYTSCIGMRAIWSEVGGK